MCLIELENSVVASIIWINPEEQMELTGIVGLVEMEDISDRNSWSLGCAREIIHQLHIKSFGYFVRNSMVSRLLWQLPKGSNIQA